MDFLTSRPYQDTLLVVLAVLLVVLLGGMLWGVWDRIRQELRKGKQAVPVDHPGNPAPVTTGVPNPAPQQAIGAAIPGNADVQEAYLAAWCYAAQVHGDQKVPGTDLPYLVHVGAVAMETLAAHQQQPFADPILAVQCALLHDTMEDCGVSQQDLACRFSPAVAEGVAALTKRKDLPKAEAMADSLARIQAQPAEVWAVKLADRITNLQPPPSHWSAEKRQVYRSEAESIRAALARPELRPLVDRLDLKLKGYRNYLDPGALTPERLRARILEAGGSLVVWALGTIDVYERIHGDGPSEDLQRLFFDESEARRWAEWVGRCSWKTEGNSTQFGYETTVMMIRMGLQHGHAFRLYGPDPGPEPKGSLLCEEPSPEEVLACFLGTGSYWNQILKHCRTLWPEEPLPGAVEATQTSTSAHQDQP